MARTFNGTSDQIAFGSDAACDQLATFTACALIRTTASITAERQVLTKMTSSYVGKMYLTLSDTDGIMVYIPRTGGVDCFSYTDDGIYTANVWSVIASTWAGDGTSPVVYHCALGGAIANVTLGGQAGSGTIWDDSSATLRAGARDPLDATFYPGGMAEVALWNRVLSADELRALGRGFAPAFFPRGRVFYSLIDGRHSPEINMAGTTHGTVTGTTFLDHPPVLYPRQMGVQVPTVGGSSFKAAWARGANVVIGAGAR